MCIYLCLCTCAHAHRPEDTRFLGAGITGSRGYLTWMLGTELGPLQEQYSSAGNVACGSRKLRQKNHKFQARLRSSKSLSQNKHYHNLGWSLALCWVDPFLNARWEQELQWLWRSSLRLYSKSGNSTFPLGWNFWKDIIYGAKEMTQWLGAFAVLPDNWSLIPSPNNRRLMTTLTPALGKPTASSGLRGAHKHACIYTNI